VQSKFSDAKLQMGGGGEIDHKVVKVLPKVWVQFDGLSKELCDFLIIWAVGSILGITKDVDMVFTRKYEVCRLQVLDPNLIPQFVDVVIGESLYSLWFKVETNGDGEEPVLMEMDNFEGDDDQHGDNLDETHDTTSHTTPPQDKGNKEAAGVGGRAPLPLGQR
jgi:hypothetical protein